MVTVTEADCFILPAAHFCNSRKYGLKVIRRKLKCVLTIVFIFLMNEYKITWQIQSYRRSYWREGESEE
ncbi:hypothetical protein VNO80_02189 [Phaseolus coccineus]|uniref:Uncharacterized protein n=1 Tax=Phaseolus coccineus TaxID=3886 RepID=A0AAN9RRG6_PHACN